MNAFGAGLIWSGVQVSLLVLCGGVVYALLRRRSPAAGSLAAFGVLAMAIGLSVLALSPWPNWWRLPAATANGAERAADNVAPAELPVEAAATAASNGRGPSTSSSVHPAAGASFDAATWARTFWQNFVAGLDEGGRADLATARRWPSIAGWALLIGIGLGLTRLAIGLAAVERYRKRTRPVSDERMVALLEATRGQLECRRSIELRESDEIAAPATIGWRRPVILLPLEWREWSEEERRIVLAHETAHVARGDFAGWLIAQVSVAIHFYNPLVHWLARRLRLEQELAADACGALVAGGSGTYLTTLAGMALRQDNRKTNWGRGRFCPPAELF